MSADSYSLWRRMLTGERVPVHEDEPVCGYYRVRTKYMGEWLPVAIFEHEGSLVAIRSNSPVDIEHVWPYCARRPVSYSAYRLVAEQGGTWPKDPTKEIEHEQSSSH